jgi:FixJ family two-component response regulator
MFAQAPAKEVRSAWSFPRSKKPFMPKGSILVVDDEVEIREGLEALLQSEGFDVTLTATGEEGLQKIEGAPFDVVLLDVSLPDRNGLEMLPEIRRRDPNLSVILITAYGSIDMARAAFKSGAMDFITKPWSNDELVGQISLAIEGRRLRDENVQLKRALKERYNFPNIVGKSEKMLAVLDLVTQVAPSRSTVLISGESGTGKEVIAKAIHAASARADKAFIPINTGSIPVDLLESQLFGHVKGAFTSAIASKKGLFEVADQGTIFFDEISSIGPETRSGNAGQASTRNSGTGIHASGIHRHHQSRRPYPGRLQRRPAKVGARGPLSRGFISPAERHFGSSSAASRTQTGHSASRRALSGAFLPGKCEGQPLIYSGSDEAADGL